MLEKLSYLTPGAWLAVACGFAAALAAMYNLIIFRKLHPNPKMNVWRHWRGDAFAVVMWLLISSAFFYALYFHADWME